MKRLLMAAALSISWNAAAHAQSDCGASGPSPKPGEVKFVSWNIAELATKTKVYDRVIRSEQAFEDLRMYRECHKGDVYALQEIASLRALGRVFPPAEFILCISGQTIADQRGLHPDYPRDQLVGIVPQCVRDASTPLSDLAEELTDPARQYVALAIRRSAQIALGDVKDFVDLGIKDPNTARPCAGASTRW